MSIVYGNNVIDKIGHIKYVCPSTKKVSYVSLAKMLITCVSNEISAWMSLQGKIFPFLRGWKLIEPYKTNAANSAELNRVLEKYLDNTDDRDTIYHTMLDSGKYPKEVVIDDCLNICIGGYATTSHSMTSVLNLLKKNSKCFDILKEELKKSGLFDIENKSNQELMRAYMECDYLNYVMKETLRIDTPILQSVLYEVYEDTQICGVKLVKGQIVGIDMVFCHNNPTQYHRPTEFLPERFDPENELFFKPGGREARHPKAFIPFSFGVRNCVGQTLAKLDSKVILVRLFEKIDFELKEEIMNNPDLKFNAFEVVHLQGKILKNRY